MTRDRRRRLYRAFLRIFPGEVRRTSGPEMQRVFDEMCREWEEERGGIGVRFWARIVWDTGRAASAEWLDLAAGIIGSFTALSGGEHMSTIGNDVRFAFRQLVRQPAYAVTIVALMALGVAANAAVFRVFNGLFLKPLPFEHAERLVDLDETAPSWDLEYLSIAYRDFDTWRAENSTFEEMAVFASGGVNLLVDGEAERIRYLSATHDIDDVLSLTPELGRFFGPEEDHPDGPRGGLLSQGFWERRFARDPGVIGRTVSFGGFPLEIIGILPPEADFLAEVDMWIPLRQTRTVWRGWALDGVGRLAPGVSLEQAEDDLTAIHKGMIDEFQVNEISSPVVSSLKGRYLGEYRIGTGFLLVAVAVVLLIACANIAGLMLARSLARTSEMSVRLALGAPRGRIVRQLMTESMVLGVLGASLGAFLGLWGSGLLLVPLAEQFPSWVRFDVDLRFIGFLSAVTVGAAGLFGLAPALHSSRNGQATATPGRSTTSRQRKRWMGALVTGEVALALVLLVVGGLSLLDVKRLAEVDTGFDAEGISTFNISLPSTRYEDAESRLAFTETYMERLGALPGVESVAAANLLPLNGHFGTFFLADGAPPRESDEANPVVLNRTVSPSYFEALGIEFVAGRPFDPFDGREDGTRAVIVNETFVRTHLASFPDPIGVRITEGTALRDGAVWETVVGVTRDVKHYGADEEMRPGVYRPLRQRPFSAISFLLRTRNAPEALVPTIRALTAEMDVELPVYDARAFTDDVEESLFTRRAMSGMFAAFSAMALLLALAGIYGVISYSVSQREKEIGIRMAMGAEKSTVLGEVVRHGMGLVAVGVGIGLLLSWAGAGLVTRLLVEVTATEPGVYAGVTVLLVLVAAVANYLPARRAARTSPMHALRGE